MTEEKKKEPVKPKIEPKKEQGHDHRRAPEGVPGIHPSEECPGHRYGKTGAVKTKYETQPVKGETFIIEDNPRKKYPRL